MRALLELKRVSKRFGSQLALDRVDLDVRAGEVHALVGHNGSGKSTLVKILAGFHQPDDGDLAIDGSPLELGDGEAARAAGLRFVHQDLALVDSLSVIDNVMLGETYPQTRPRRIDWRRARHEVTELMISQGYEIDVQAPVANLRPVERTGVAIARALRGGSVPARVLVLDEPTAALPANAVESLFGALRRLRERGLGIIYISHHLEEVFSIAERVTVLRDGERVTTRPTAGLTEDELVELMIGRTVNAHQRSIRTEVNRGRLALQVRGLAAGGLIALDLDVAEGEVVGLAGVAGSGRDEAAAALFGALPRRGTVKVNGRIVPPDRPDASIASGLGMVGANRARTGLVGRFTVAQNLTLARIDGSLAGWFLSHKREERDSLEWLDLIELRPRDPSKPVTELSGGNQQKVLLGRWLRALPSVLLVDQPTEGVDIGTVEQIYRVIRRRADEGTAFVISSPDTDELVALCDRVLVLSRGVVAAELTGSQIERDLIDQLCLSATAPRGGAR